MSGPFRGGTGATPIATHADVSGAVETPSTKTRYRNGPRNGKLHVRVEPQNGGRAFVASGQEARTIVALHRAGPKGVTALEVSSWALRLAAYTFALRKRGLDIETAREAHEGGWHGRHVLQTSIRLVF